MVRRFLHKHKRSIVPDLLAGLTGAVAGAPQAMGFAIIAGVSPLYGLYAAVVSTIVGALVGSSTFMTVAPTNALALVVGTTLVRFDDASQIEVLFVLTFLVGVFQLAFGVLRLGDLTRFVSNAVMTGFITGAGALIILGQLNHLTGYDNPVRGGILLRFWDWLTHLNQGDLQTTVVGVAATIIIFTLHHTRFRSIATLTAILITSTVVTVLGWGSVELVRDMSPIPSALPMPVLPDLQYAPGLLMVALAMAMLASVQSAAISNSVREPDGSESDASRDFIGQGVANIATAFFRGMPAGGSLSRTAINVASGACTRLSNVVAGVLVALVLLAFGGLIERVTLAALAGHLIVAAVSLINVEQVWVVWQVNSSARASMVITFLSTLVLPLEYSIYIGIILSLAVYVYTSAENIKATRLISVDQHQFSETDLPERLPDQEPVIVSVSGNLYFAAVKSLEEALPSPVGVKNPVVILRLRDNQYLGSTGIRSLSHYAQQLDAAGGKFLISGVGPRVMAQLIRTGALKDLGEENIFTAEGVIFSATEHALDYARMWLAAECEDGIAQR